MAGAMTTDWKLPPADTYFRPLLDADPRGFQIDHLEAALAHVQNWRTAVDGGAHVGTWTVRLAGRFQHVVAFEPARDAWSCLWEHVRAARNVVPLMVALGAENLRAAVIDDATRPGNTGARYLAEGDAVRIVPLDSLSIVDLDFLKLDVEGYEYFALMGALRTIQRCRPVVMIEDKHFNGRYGLKRGMAAELLESWGMREVARVKNDRVFSF